MVWYITMKVEVTIPFQLIKVLAFHWLCVIESFCFKINIFTDEKDVTWSNLKFLFGDQSRRQKWWKNKILQRHEDSKWLLHLRFVFNSYKITELNLVDFFVLFNSKPLCIVLGAFLNKDKWKMNLTNIDNQFLLYIFHILCTEASNSLSHYIVVLSVMSIACYLFLIIHY